MSFEPLSRQHSVQRDRIDSDIRPLPDVPQDGEKRRIYEAQLRNGGANLALRSRLTSSSEIHADSIFPSQTHSRHRPSDSQSSPLRNVTFSMSPPPPDYEYTQGSSSDHEHGHARYSSSSYGHTQYPSSTYNNSAHGNQSRSGTEDSQDHEMATFRHSLPLVTPHNEHAALLEVQELGHQEVVDPDIPRRSFDSRASLSKDLYTVEHMVPGHITVTLSANMSVDAVEASENVAFQLSKSRVASLQEVDGAQWSWFHFKVCMIAGVGFFTDAYDIFAINIAATMINYVYNNGNEPNGVQGALLKASAPVGTLIGQLVFGRLADVAGRKRMYGVELIIIIIGTFGQALSAEGTTGTVSIYATLIVWRFIMGVGIGGDYPLSAVISSEFAPSHIRGRMMTIVFSNQGLGQFSASALGTFILLAFRNGHSGSISQIQLNSDIDRAWRILLGLGCVPAVVALYFRLTIPETPRFTMDIERNVDQAKKDIETFLQTGGYKYDPDSVVIRVNAPRASFGDFVQYFRSQRNAVLLFGCAYSWFAIDVAFYGVGLNTDKFFCAIGFARSVYMCEDTGSNSTSLMNSTVPMNTISIATRNNASLSKKMYRNIFDDFINLCIANLLFSCMGLILGYVATFFFIDRWGRKKIQLTGFTVLSVLFLIMGLVLPHLTPQTSPPSLTDAPTLFGASAGSRVMLFLFCFAGFFLNFGPNVTTFVVPGETFPTRYRSTCHGLSAASGKLGAIISQFAVVQPLSTAHALLVFVAFTVTGLIATCFIEETNQKTLEYNSNEPQDSFVRGLAQPGRA